jgi:succinyl-CoA synthetase alpha subunit
MPTASTEAGIVARVLVRPREYFDSVFLMRVSESLARLPGVRDAAAVMGTAANVTRLVELGITPADVARAQPDDLVVAIRAATMEAADAAIQQLEELLTAEAPTPVVKARTIDEAVAALPSANIAVISVPGEHAAREARRAIERGLHAFVFSSNVPVDEERALKEEAARRGLLVMGPDCGTAIVRGIGLGFANAVRRGRIGVVGPSGTGIQEVTSLVHQLGVGISHALGTGSHDVTDAIGGLSTVAALGALAADDETDLLVLVSKPPGPRTRARLDDVLRHCRKPVVTCILGEGGSEIAGESVDTFEDAAMHAVAHVIGGPPVLLDPPGVAQSLARARATFAATQRALRGLFAGGSFAVQAWRLLRASGVALAPHAVVDLGAEMFTAGRPHPMIDSRLRRERIAAAGRDAEVAVVLFDVILGYGAASDPAGDLVEAIAAAQAEAARAGRQLAFVASITGTDADPQGLARQHGTLAEAGVIVLPTTARAARAAASLVGGPSYE